MSRLNKRQQLSETVSSEEISSTSCLPLSGCLDFNKKTVGSMTNVQVPIYPPPGMTYIPSSPSALHRSLLGLQQAGSPEGLNGFSPQYPYPVGFLADYSPAPFASSEGNAPQASRKGPKRKLRCNAKAASSSATRKLPGKNVRQKVNNSHGRLKKGGLRRPSTSGGFDVARDKIRGDIDGNPPVTTAGNRPDTIIDPAIASAAFRQPLNSSILSPNFGYNPFEVYDSRPPNEFRDRHHKNQEERGYGNGNDLSGPSTSNFPSLGSWYDEEAIRIAGEGPSVSNALGPLRLNEASHLAPRGYPDILSRKGASLHTRSRITKPSSREGVKRFPHRIQDPLGSTYEIQPENGVRGQINIGELLREISNQRANSFAGIPKHTSPAIGEESFGVFQPRLFCNLCKQTFRSLVERYVHYRVIHRILLSDRDTFVPLFNLRDLADISRVTGFGARGYIPLNKQGLGSDLAIPIISADIEGYYPNSLDSWNAVGALDFGIAKSLAFK